MTTDLDALAASYERGPGTRCTVCAFVEAQAEPAPWDALLAGRRSSAAVASVMRDHGYELADGAQTVRRHRRLGHRA